MGNRKLYSGDGSIVTNRDISVVASQPHLHGEYDGKVSAFAATAGIIVDAV